jgi:type I restriction enzyme M protein
MRAGGGKKAGEFYTPQQVSTILSRIVSLDSQDPSMDKKKKLGSVFDFACGSNRAIKKQNQPHFLGLSHNLQSENL